MPTIDTEAPACPLCGCTSLGWFLRGYRHEQAIVSCDRCEGDWLVPPGQAGRRYIELGARTVLSHSLD